MPPISWCLSQRRLSLPPMATFLWTLQCGGVAITLLGMGRDRWLRARRLGR